MRALILLLVVALTAAACAGDDESSDTVTVSSVERAGNSTDGDTGNDDIGADDDTGPVAAADLVDGGATVIVANSPGTLSTNGPQRLLVALIGTGTNEILGGEDVEASLELIAPDGDASDVVEARWQSTVGAPLGLYVASYAFPKTGRWQVRIEGSGEGASGALVDVFDESVVPEPGDPAPASATPTAAEGAALDAITTDPEPDPDLYRLSIGEAVANGQPTVIVFATPAFCQTALCGPTLDIVKAAVTGRDGLDVVHVEPFELEQARAGSLVPVETMSEWHLATEPWVFVVDGDGLIAASFEGLVSQAEIEAAIDNL
jgi:hypothetical protein